MKVRIINHENVATGIRWWYSKRIGEEFEVRPDPERKGHYYTDAEFMGKVQQLHILKEHCEVIEE